MSYHQSRLDPKRLPDEAPLFLRRSEGSDGTDWGGWSIDEAHGRYLCEPGPERGSTVERSEASPVDAELAHAGPQRVRVDLEQPGGAARALDASQGRL